jgi:menaquinone-specific isochorismate synthase
LARLAAQLARALSLHAGMRRDGLLSISLPVPELARLRPPAGAGGFAFWARPELHEARLALGRAAGLATSGETRLAEACALFRIWRAGWVHDDAHGTGATPRAWAAFAFDPDDAMRGNGAMGQDWAGFPNTLIEAPALLAQCKDARVTFTFTCRGEDLDSPDAVLSAWIEHAHTVIESDAAVGDSPAFPNRLTNVAAMPAADAWRALAGEACDAVRDGALHKVVLARRVTLRGQRPFDVARVIEALSYRYPACTQIAWRDGAATLVAASPETLVTVRGGAVRSDAIAGTTRRSADAAQDRHLEQTLFDCAKSRHEHALVVGHVADALAGHCSGVRMPARPELLSLRFVHHLKTPVHGRLRADRTLLDLLQNLHPTPAVCGTPTIAALAWLRAHEPFPRGWYSGAAGWVTPAGEGEFQVLLRCALLDGHQAHLFAGAGIVADSDPRAEFEETELKLETMRDALQDA